MKLPKRSLRLLMTSIACALGPLVMGCGLFGGKRRDVVPAVPVASIPGHGAVAQDTSPKEDLRLVPAEAYMRTYLELFGGLAPLEVQRRARGAEGSALFDTWDEYVAALGLPDYRSDLPRSGQTNALMIATFERLGAALCDRALEHDLRPFSPVAVTTPGGAPKPLEKPTKPAPKNLLPVTDRIVFAFEVPEGPAIDLAAFTARFDVLHRTFLGYPAALAPPTRVGRFKALYDATVARHLAQGAAPSRLSPAEAGWSAVCQGLVRHPEFHLY